MAIITITRGLIVQVDDADFDWLNQWKWQARPTTGSKFHAHRGGVFVNGRRTTVLMHRFIMGAGDATVDHINRDSLDNRRCNLRWASRKENSRNKSAVAVSGFKGVGRTQRGAFAARIVADGVAHHLGTFCSAEEAARAYDEAAVRLHGDFAATNAVLGTLR